MTQKVLIPTGTKANFEAAAASAGECCFTTDNKQLEILYSGTFYVLGGLFDMLSNVALAGVNYTNPSGSTFAYNEWNRVTATAACNAKLPAPSSGKMVGVRVDPGSTNVFTLNRNTADTIDSATSRLMWAGESAVLLSDGTNWYKVAGNTKAMVCEMSSGAGQSIANNTVTKVTLDTSVVDNTGLMADPSTNHRINVQRAGDYMLAWYVQFVQSPGAASDYFAYVFKNGSSLRQATFTQAFVSQFNHGVFSGYLANLAASDYLELDCFQESGASQTLQTTSTANPILIAIEVPSW